MGDKRPADKMSKKSKLSYGADLDMSGMSTTEPAGEEIDYKSIMAQLDDISKATKLKILYQITVRGQETKKTRKSTRTAFKNSVDGANEVVYISFATGETSVQKDELTPGRARLVLCASLTTELTEQNFCSPVMAVVGFKEIMADFESIKTKLGKMITQATTEADDIESRLINARIEELEKVAKGAGMVKQAELFPSWYAETVTGLILVPSSWYYFACGPDRCLPIIGCSLFMLEVGASFALAQDMRNCILSSIIRGTADDKNKARSSFEASFERRSAQGTSLVVNPRLFQIIFNILLPYFETNMQLRTKLPETVRQAAQDFIDKKVKAMSANVPEKI